MSDEIVSHKEDKENLLYIFRQLHLEEFSLGEDHYRRDSISAGSINTSPASCSDINLYKRISKQHGPEIFTDPDVLAKTKPFEFNWTYGINSKLGVINLTIGDRKDIFFTSCHSPIIYNYCTKQMKHLEGHQYLISCISADNSGQWLATADDQADGCVIIWDSKQCKPVSTLFSIYPSSGVLLVQLSGSARYLITIGCTAEGNYSIDFWLWTLGNDSSDGSYVVEKSYGSPVTICFNPNTEEHIMIAFKKQVFFFLWDIEKKRLRGPKIPQITHKNRIGGMTGATYLDNCHQCYATSHKGCILVFGNTLYSKPFEEGQLDNAKIYIKAIKVTPVPIRCCTTIDDLLVVGDTRGFILFFDNRVRIKYWLVDFSLGPITSISFNLVPKFRHEDPNAIYTPKYKEEHIFECDVEDITEELDILFKKDLPKDASLENKVFIVNDFFVATGHCNVFAINCLRHICTPLFHIADDNVSAIETHEEFPYIIIGYANGRLLMINHENNELVSNTTLPTTEENSSISCLKYSFESRHLVCGRENGEIWILEPILLTPKIDVPFRPTKNKVQKITFSSNTTEFAYYDDNRTVVIFTYDADTSQWEFGGKIRSHYDQINDIMFMPGEQSSTLYTISSDRHMVEYSRIKHGVEFSVVSRDRIEQTAIPMNFIYWFESTGEKKSVYFLVADNQHKFKILYPNTKVPRAVVLAPAFGCFKNQLIRKMRIIPKSDLKYLAFLTKKHIGIQMLLPDGNPYKYVGYLAHPKEIGDFVLSPDGKYIFTYGVDDHCVLKWEIRPKSVDITHLLGGKELEPFYCLIEGGKNGWLFQEIKDLFYYMQILQQNTIDLPRRVSDCIGLAELPDLVRTCGFYPTEFELENMMIDIKYRNYFETAKINEEVNFIDFVKLFCNHKPAYGYSKEKVQRAFDILLDNVDTSSADAIKRYDLFDMLTTSGEVIGSTVLNKYFRILMRSERLGAYFDTVPEEINFQILFDEILGIDMERSKIWEGENEDEGIVPYEDNEEAD